MVVAQRRVPSVAAALHEPAMLRRKLPYLLRDSDS